MPRDELHAVILDTPARTWRSSFLSYATDLMEREPMRAAENASSLLLIGYLIRSFEEDLDGRTVDNDSPFLH